MTREQVASQIAAAIFCNPRLRDWCDDTAWSLAWAFTPYADVDYVRSIVDRAELIFNQ